jgi:SagB-type dehydrogenase family enzyme
MPMAPATGLIGELRNRNSERKLGGCTLSQLGAVLCGAYEVLAVADGPDGTKISHRPTPSAGARHPFRLVVLSHAVSGLNAGWWEFDAFARKLDRWEGASPEIGAAMSAICAAGNLIWEPAAAIFPICEPERTLRRYPAGATLLWRDVGALEAILHLCAHDVGLGSCIIGTSGLVTRNSIGGGNQDMGAVVVGRRR